LAGRTGSETVAAGINKSLRKLWGAAVAMSLPLAFVKEAVGDFLQFLPVGFTPT
jgi:hypothetical protein